MRALRRFSVIHIWFMELVDYVYLRTAMKIQSAVELFLLWINEKVVVGFSRNFGKG